MSAKEKVIRFICAHAYQTKAPHKAIIHYITHYTNEGDIIFDGFCGTGMTGIAAELINRNAILSDLSPAATFIASNYNSPMDGFEFEREVKKLLSSVQDECGWMYETRHVDGTTIGIINYVVWSDVFICPFCKQEYVLWDVAIDENDHNKVKDDFLCPNCNAQIKQNNCERLKIVNFDSNINKDAVQAKQCTY